MLLMMPANRMLVKRLVGKMTINHSFNRGHSILDMLLPPSGADSAPAPSSHKNVTYSSGADLLQPLIRKQPSPYPSICPQEP